MAPARSALLRLRLRPHRVSLGLALAGLSAFSLGGVRPALARPEPVTFRNHYQAEIVGPDTGFPENSCSGIAPAPDGSLWMGTFRGLVRYNGQTYRHWAPPEIPHLARTGIVNLHRDNRGGTWFSTQRGLVRHDGRTWHDYGDVPAWGDVRDPVRSYAGHPEKPFVFGRFSGAVTAFDGRTFTPLPALPGQGGAFCAYDGGGTLYASRGGYVHVLTAGAWQPLADSDRLPTPALGLGQDPAGQVLLVAAREVVRLRDNRVVSRLDLQQPVTQFWESAIDRHGNLWLASLANGAFRISPDGSVLNLGDTEGMPSPGGVRTVYPAPDGLIWVGAGVGGFTRLRAVRFRYLGRPPAIGEREILSLAPLSDGSLLLAPNGAELHRFDGLSPTAPVIPPVDDPGSGRVRTVLHAHDGTVWCGTAAGLHRWVDRRLVPETVPGLPPGETVLTLFEDSRQRLWIGGERTVVRRSAARTEVVALPPARGNALFAERRDGAVAVARRNEIHLCRDDGEPALIAQLVPEAQIGTILADDRDRLWIGTLAHGLFVFHQGALRAFPANRSVAGSNVHALVADAHGYIWFGGERRIVRVHASDLWALALDPTADRRVQVFDADDGLRNIEFPFATQPAVARDAAGRLWFALIRGAARIDPSALEVQERPPPVRLEALTYQPHDDSDPITVPLAGARSSVQLPPGARSIKLEFAALDFASPAKQRFLVRLDGAPQSREPQRESSITFVRLPPGTHNIQVQASGSDGVWNRDGAWLQVGIAPFYWQTLWFQFLAAGAIVSLVGGSFWLAGQRRVQRVRLQLEREQRLAAAQARLALVLENTTDFVLFSDAAGRVLFLNPAGRTLIGLAPGEDLAGTSATRLLAAAARQPFTAALATALRSGTWNGELALTHREGGDLPVSAVLVAHPRRDGSLEFAALIARDISAARRQAADQEALRRLATALNASLPPPELGRAIAGACRQIFRHDAFFLLLVENDTGTAAYMEDTAEGATEPAPVPTLSRSVSPRLQPVLAGQTILLQRPAGTELPPEDKLRAWGHAGRISRSLVFVPILRDGTAIGMISIQSYTAHRYTDEDGRRLRALADQCGAAIARMRAERRLRENEERLRLAMQAARMGSWEIDIESRTLLASPEAEAIYGRSLGRDPAALAAGLDPAHASEFGQLLGAAMAGRTDTLAHIQLSPGPEPRWFEVKARRLADTADPRQARLIGVTADITARKRNELERTRLEEQLRQAQKLESVGTLAGGIAHDFNNILTAVLGNVELARLELPSEQPAVDFIDRIHESGLRARDLVRRLLAFSRPNPRRHGVASLPAIVGEVTRLLRATIPATTELRVFVPAEVPPVAADPTEIHQVLMNLGTNAWHALGRRPGWIAFGVEACEFPTGGAVPHPDLRPGRHVRVRVQDNGNGIAPGHLPRIFDPFFTTKPVGEGSGLGLSVAHGIMRGCGGAILVESTVGAGTTFDLYFRVATGTEPTAARPPAREPAVVSPVAGRILFVDDEEALLLVARHTLRLSGYEVTTFARPSEALARFRASPADFDLVLTDLAMPEMSGVMFAQQVLALRPDIPVLVISGHIPPDQAEEAQRIGVRAVLEKIDHFTSLPAILARHLGARDR
jgi:PAS domain S-box-containing protein